VFQNLSQNAFVIQFCLTVRDYARWHQILHRSRATKRKHAGVNATAIGAGQNLPNRNTVSAEGFSDALGLLYTGGTKGLLPPRSSRARVALSLLGCRRAHGATG
jgi:hypothetical protein